MLKVHQQVYKHAVADKGLRSMLVPNELPTNDMLAATDVLVTDYSSIFIDFLATGRPVLFFTPDLADYENRRGFYLPFEDWPGPVCRELDELVANIKQLNTGGDDDPALVYRDKYTAARERYCADEDGAATARVIDVVFRGNEKDHDVRRGLLRRPDLGAHPPRRHVAQRHHAVGVVPARQHRPRALRRLRDVPDHLPARTAAT